MSTDVNKLAEEYALQPLPPEVFTAAHAFRDHGGDEQTTGVVRVIERAAYLAGFRAALECEEVKQLRSSLRKLDEMYCSADNPLNQKERNDHRMGLVIARKARELFDRLLEGVKA